MGTLDPAADGIAVNRPARPEGDDAERRDRGEARERGHRDVEHVDRRSGEEALLAQQLDQVGDRLQQPEPARAVGPVALLHSPDQLPLEPGGVGEREQHEVRDHECLDERDPPRLGHAETLRCSGGAGAGAIAAPRRRSQTRSVSLMTRPPPALASASSFRDLHRVVEARRVVLWHADGWGEAAVEAGPQLDARPVGTQRYQRAARDAAGRCVLGRDLHLGSRPLELQLGHALDCGAGEERAVGQQTQLGQEVGRAALIVGHLVCRGRRGGL